MTVLFADVVDSTRLSQHLDPEDMLAVMDGGLRRRFAAIIERHGGRVLQFAGDGLHAAFGAEATREDDPARAVRAGLALLAEAKLHAADVATQFAVPDFAIRVGINTGQVLMGAASMRTRRRWASRSILPAAWRSRRPAAACAFRMTPTATSAACST